jgi:UDP-N-acetylmuramoylalanine--D-glutamate ligase
METTEIRGNKILIVGFSREGQSVLSWLKVHYPTATIGVADQHENAMAAVPAGITTFSGEKYLAHLDEFTTVIRSPGVSPFLPELVAHKHNGGHITSATNIFLSLYGSQSIGVTGTKGKSTTASLIAHILGANGADVRLVGNIGKPMFDHVQDVTDKTQFVAELSSHQLADSHFSPHIAAFLGVVPEHMDYYPSFAEYVAAKERITGFQTKNDIFVCNLDAPQVTAVAERTKAKVICFGQHPNALVRVREGNICLSEVGRETVIMSVADVPLLGNVENILAAIAVCVVSGISLPDIKKAIVPFKSLPHRLERVGVYRDITFVNDSLATIPEAAVHALTALGDRVHTLIAGGFDRHIDFSVLGEYLATHPVPVLILFPDTGKYIWESIVAKNPDTTIEKIDINSMEEAVKAAYAKGKPGTICLLSPASASYNMFRDYADRGDQFASWVKTLG